MQTYNSHVRNISVATLWTIQTLQVIEGQFHLCSVKIKHGDAVFSFYTEQIINELPETAGLLQLRPFKSSLRHFVYHY